MTDALTPSPRLILVAFLFAGVGRGEDAVRLRAVNPKAVYRPGETFALEMVCAPGMTDEAVILSGPGGKASNPLPKCPRARVEVRVPRDFVGRSAVSVLVRRGGPAGDIFSFQVRSDIAPKDLHISTSGVWMDPEACSALWFDPELPVAQSVQLVALQPDGTLFNLCKGADLRVTTDQPDSFQFNATGNACSILSRREGSFKLTASYGGLRKEFTCRAESLDPEAGAKPRSTPVPPGPQIAGRPREPLRISIPDFRHDPLKLDHHPAEVGRCRLVEHWTTGYCYVYSLPESRKVSEHTDVLCDDLGELRKRMNRAIEDGHCN